MIVADSSVVIDALRRSGDCRDRLIATQVFAPHLVDLEVLNVIRRKVRASELPHDHGTELVRRLGVLEITRYPIYGLTERIWALRENLTAYDAAYVAVAEALECPLVTADGRLARAPGPKCDVTLIPLSG